MKIVNAVTTLAVACFAVYGCNEANPERKKEARATESRIKEVNVEITRSGSYVIKCWSDEMGITGGFEVFKDGKRIFSGEPIPHRVEKIDGHGARDINGDAIPDVVVESYSGGAHCCFTTFVFALGDEFQKVAEFDGENTPVGFKDCDGDGIYEVTLADWTFQYWKTSFADSPAEEVILRYKGGDYVVAKDLMRKEPPSQVEFEENVRDVRKGFFRREVPSSLWTHMLDLIYTGNGDLAWKFFNECWPAGRTGKERFLKEFKEQLGRSRYSSEIRSLNGW
ncbi:MAG: hypothetical protein WBD36_03880 [Bacteroidota bacterium]